MTREELEKLKKNAEKYSSTSSRSATTSSGGGINQEQFNSLKENADKYVSSTARYATQSELANYYKNGAPTLTDGIMKARYGHVLKSQAYMNLSNDDKKLIQLNNQVDAYKRAKSARRDIGSQEKDRSNTKSDSYTKAKKLVENLESELKTQYQSIFGAEADFDKWLGSAALQGADQFNTGLANLGAMVGNLIPSAINEAYRAINYGTGTRQWVNQYDPKGKDEEVQGWLTMYESLEKKADDLYAQGNKKEGDYYRTKAREYRTRISDKYADYLKGTGEYWLIAENEDPFSEYAQMVNEVSARNQEEYQKQLEYQKLISNGSGKGWETAGSFITSAVGALPYAGLALMTGGASLGGEIGAQLAPQTTGIISKVANTFINYGKDPQYWLSFAQEAGNTYKEALDAGADQNVATLTATLVGLINGAIELGLGGDNAGIQDLPERLLNKGKGTRKAIQEWIESAVSEGKEEILQGVISNLAEKIAYNKDKKWIGEGGVIDTQALTNEGLMGMGVGALLGGGQIMGVNVMNEAVQNRIDKANERLGQRYSEQADTIIENARQMGPETKSYQLASDILEKGSHTDAEIGELYRAYMGDTGYNQSLRTNTIQAVQQRLTELGETSDTRELAEIIAKEADGQKITKAETQAIENSKYGQRVVNELFNAYRGDYSSNWVRGLATQDELTQAKAAPELTSEQRAERIESIEQNRPEHTEEEYQDIDKLAERYGAQANIFKEAAKAVEGTNLYDFADAYHLVYQEAKAGLSEESIKKEVKASWLSPAAFKLAYNAGQDAMVKKPKGTRYDENAAIQMHGFDYKNLSTKQKDAIRAFMYIPKITGINIDIFNSANEDGTLGEKQGWYSKGRIGIDINAGMLTVKDLANSAMPLTLGHELTHFIQDNNDAAYQELKQFVFNALQTYQFSDGKYRDSDTWIRSKMLQNKWEYAEGTAEFNKYYQMASDECVADACEMMLRDTTAFETLAKENQTLAEKMLSWLKDLIADIKKAFEGIVESHLEARAMLDVLDELQQKWDSALVGAVQNTKKAESNQQSETETQNSIRATSEQDADSLINSAMSMDQCRDMVQRAFILAGIKEWYDGEYKNGDEWLKGAGVDEVAMYIENEYTLQEKYLNKIPALMSGDIALEEILDAYLDGSLLGTVSKPKAQRLDVTQDTNYRDSRFYAPQDYNNENVTALYETANQKVTNKNRAEVYKARAKLLFIAHDGNVAEKLGITPSEFNKRLRSWSRYSKNALDISKRINSNVPVANRWTGIQNCSIINKMTISDEDILQMVKDITGKSSEYKRAYIGRTMLALDTHINWSNLSFEFLSGGFENKKTTRGLYYKNKISIANSGYANTVAHEMGHALDAIWGRDVFGEEHLFGSDVFLTETNLRPDLIKDAETKQFYDNFRAFVDSITDTSDIGSSYKADVKEVFARFVAKFVEFTDSTAGNNFYQESSAYHDRFTASQYLEFAKLLQEKAMLDSKKASMADTQFSTRVTPEQNARYMELAKDPQKNEAELRRMVEQAAEVSFKDSKIRTKDGKLRMVYHLSGTDKIRIFQPGNSAGLIYFADSPEAAKRGARASQYTYAAYLNARKPVNTKETATPWYDAEDSIQVAKWRRQGYDGVYVKDESGVSFAVFDSSQIKSADPVTYDSDGKVIPLNQRFNTDNEDIRYSTRVTPQQDREYLKLARNPQKNRAELQRMVEQAAEAEMPDTVVKKKGGELKLVWHGTMSQFNTFKRGDIGFHFGTKTTATTRVGRGKNTRLIKAYLNITNPIKIDVDFGSWDADYRLTDYLREQGVITLDEARSVLYTETGNKYNTGKANSNLRSLLMNKGYDGIVYDNAYEADGSASYIVFDSKQIKSAEPVTYDNSGNVIPLSERFNAENEDIRYQNRINDTEETEEAPKEKAPTNPYYAKKDLRTDMLNLFSIPVGRRSEMGAIIDKYADKMLAAGAITQYDYNDLIDELYANGVVIENAAPEYAEARKILRGKKVYVPERVKTDFGDDWSAFRQKAFAAGIYLTNNTQDMHPDQWNATLAEDLPGLFDASELDERTMLEQMVDYATLGKDTPTPLKDYDKKLYRQGVVDEETLTDDYERRVQQLLEKFAEKAQLEVVLRERSDKVIGKQRQALETARRRSQTTAVRHKITNLMGRWNTKLVSNTPGKNIPAQFIAAMSELSQAMDLTTDKPLSKAAVDKLTKLWAVYESIDNDKDFSIYKDPVVAQMVSNIISNIISDTKVRYMSLEQLNELYDALKALDTVMRTATKRKDAAYRGDIYKIGKALIGESNEAIVGKSEFWRDLKTWQLTPRRFFAMLGGWMKGSTWETQVGKSFEDGRRRAIRVERDHYNHFKAFTESKEMDRLTNRHKLIDIGLTDKNGESVKITRGMMLSIYMHLLADDNRRAILYGGFNIPDMAKYYANKIAAAYGTGHENSVGILEDMTKLSREILDISTNDDLTEDEKQQRIAEIAKKQYNLEKEGYDRLDALKNRIYNEMSDFEKKLCEAVTAWNDGKSRDYINEVNLEMYGIKRAKVKNYYPIHRDTSYVQTDFASISKNVNLNNVGWLKDRVKSAAPVLLTDIVYEMDNGIKSLSTYYGFVKAQTDFTKIYNVKLSGTNVSVKGVVGDKFGKGPKSFGVTADQYIENFIGDVVGSRLKPETSIFAAIRRNLPRATLTLNPRVALSQVASVPTAAAEVGWGSMVRGFAKGIPHAFSKSYKENLANESEYFFQRYRGEGGMREFADMKSGSMALDKLWNKMANTVVGRMLFNWCQDADVFATATMWAMAEDWVEHNTDLKGEEFKAAVKEKYEDILINTQPNYTPTERSDLLRDTRDGYKFFTMYKTQSNQNFNILVEANARLKRTASDLKNKKNGVTQQDLKEARKQFANAYTGLFIGGTLTFIGFRALVNALLGHMNDYRDDDDEITTVSVLEGLTKAYIQSIAGMFVLGTEVENAIESVVSGKRYYGLEDSALSTIGNSIESFINLAQAYAQGKTDNIGNKWAKFAQNTLQTMGLPYSSVKTLVEGGKTWINDIENGTFGQFEGNVTRSNKTNYSRLYQAYENGDTGKAERIMDELYRNDPDIEDSEIRNGLRDVIKDMWSGGLISDGEAVEKLIEYVGMDDDPAYWKVQEWYNKSIDEEAGSSPYYRLKSVITNDEDASDAITELLDHGKKADDVADYVRNDIIKAAFKDGTITEAEAVEKLVKYGQKKDHSKLVKYTQAEAQAIVDNWSKTNSLGWDYSKKAELLQSGEVSKADIKKALMDIEGYSSEKADTWIAKNSLGWSYQDRAYLYGEGEITKSELKKALMSVDGMSSEQADQTIETYEWSNAGYEVEPNQYNAIIGQYYDTIQKAGISKAIWYDYYKWQSKARADKDANGESINGTKMRKVFEYIGKLNITNDQKMALARTYTDNEKSIAKYKTW